MIPTVQSFIRKNYSYLKAAAVQATPAAANVNAIAFVRGTNRTTQSGTALWYLWDITLASVAANMWAPGMSVTLASTTFPAGVYEIESVLSTGLRIWTREPRGSQAQTSPAGTATPTGIIELEGDYTTTGDEVLNNAKELIGLKYTDTQYFLVRLTNEKSREAIIQVVNTHASAAVTVTIEESINAVHWAALPTAVSGDSIAAGATKTYHFKDYYDKFLKVTVTATSSEYQVMMK